MCGNESALRLFLGIPRVHTFLIERSAIGAPGPLIVAFHLIEGEHQAYVQSF